MIEVFTKPNCSYCVQAKHLLVAKGKPFVEIVIGEGVSRDAFVARFPNVKTAPAIVIDGVLIGGYDHLSQLSESWTDPSENLLVE